MLRRQLHGKECFSAGPKNRCLYLKLLNDKGSLMLTFKALLAHSETCGLLSFGNLQDF